MTKRFRGTACIEEQNIRDPKDAAHPRPDMFGYPIMIDRRQFEESLRLGVLCDLGANTAFVIRFVEIRHFQRI